MAITIQTAADVTAEALSASEEVFEGWFDNDGEPIDWYAFYDRLEMFGWCIQDVTSPAAMKIQRHIRKFRAL